MSRKGLVVVGAVLLGTGVGWLTAWLLSKTADDDGAGIANVLALPVGALSLIVGVFSLVAARANLVARPNPPVRAGAAYRIVAKHSGLVLDVLHARKDNGTPIIQCDWHGGANQRFEFVDLGDGTYRIVSLHSGRCLDVLGVSTDIGAKLVQFDWHGGGNQRFLVIPA
ncbi:RICIN domain-containing protein [Allokutzneria sp. A3M-2-11 16]|uniref:RICIN domain-containing protein n=1 Tax=Allokutzneria sp. A3M-2-11 16 TaxID=2962043 RepID=UPI0020B86919|nr:RICIN domain-containing protein [Allokutzneria sp. A3M-2-11 16]MCP3805130.1 RICIN domain-containing protein [Allokutzneria sp. A3M-2-11 16]